MRDDAFKAGVPAEAIERETAKFLDHYRAKGERRADWSASWRNWMRRAVE
jgi:hypothetical protein